MAIKTVSVLVLDGLAVFEFGVVCEVFGIDRSAEGVPNFDFKVCGPEPGRPLRTSVGATIVPDHGLDDLIGADLVAKPPAPEQLQARFVQMFKNGHELTRVLWLGADGRVLARFSPRTTPDDPALIQAIEKALG